MSTARRDSATTIEPVTLCGWYELTDGRVAKFTWRGGLLQEDRVVASWAKVPSQQEGQDALIPPATRE